MYLEGLLAFLLLWNGVAAQNVSLTVSPAVSYTNTTSVLDQILARGFLRVGTTGDYKPFSYLVTNATRALHPNTTTRNTTYIGADIDMAQSLSNALGLPSPPQLVPTVWANLSTSINRGEFDIAMGGVSITLARQKTAFFSTAIQKVGKTACIRCNDTSKYTSLTKLDVSGTRIAVNPGGTNEVFDRANFLHAQIITVADNNAVYEAVINGTADAMVSDQIEVELQMKLHEGKLCIVNPNEAWTFEELGYLLPRDATWKGFVDLWVHIQLGGGSWNTTLIKWMDYEWPGV